MHKYIQLLLLYIFLYLRKFFKRIKSVSGENTNVVPKTKTSANAAENTLPITNRTNHLRRYSSNESCLNDRPCLSKPRSRQPLQITNNGPREMYSSNRYLPPHEIKYASCKLPSLTQVRYERSLSCRSTPTNFEPSGSYSSATCSRYYAMNSSRNDMCLNRGSATNLTVVHEKRPFSLRNDNLLLENPSRSYLKNNGEGSSCKNVRFAPPDIPSIEDHNAEKSSKDDTVNNEAPQKVILRFPSVSSPTETSSNTQPSAGCRYSMQDTCEIINDIDRLLFWSYGICIFSSFSKIIFALLGIVSAQSPYSMQRQN